MTPGLSYHVSIRQLRPDMTLGAIGIEFSRLPSMFGLMKKFDRAAVLTDKTWLKKVSEFEGALFPGLEIRAFNIDQKAEAEAWLSS